MATGTKFTAVERRLVEQYWERVGTKTKQINNSSLHAGSPMYFYCRHCGVLTDTLPENYISPPSKLCGGCKRLVEAALMPPPKL